MARDGCRWITDAGISVLGERFQTSRQRCMPLAQLTAIDVSKLPRVSDTGICKLVYNRSNLTDLNVALCGSVGDASLRALAASCAELRALNLTAGEHTVVFTYDGTYDVGWACSGQIHVAPGGSVQDARILINSGGCHGFDVPGTTPTVGPDTARDRAKAAKEAAEAAQQAAEAAARRQQAAAS